MYATHLLNPMIEAYDLRTALVSNFMIGMSVKSGHVYLASKLSGNNQRIQQMLETIREISGKLFFLVLIINLFANMLNSE